MGVDWIPCRVEPGFSNEEMEEHVRREANYFRTGGFSVSSILFPGSSLEEFEREPRRSSCRELGELRRKLLFKHESHRVSVISKQELFPIEWRLAAERTILPWQLDGQLSEWKTYRDEVAKGMHRGFLSQLYVWNCLHSLVTVDLSNLIGTAKASINNTGSWSRRPEVIEIRERLLSKPVLELPEPPRWPSDNGDLNPADVIPQFEKVRAAIVEWNSTIRRGNFSPRLPERPFDFEPWISERLNDSWFGAFLDWVEPWRQGGYGLYRDCE